MDFKEKWLPFDAVVPVDAETTQALVEQIHRLVRLVGDIRLDEALQEPVAWMMTNAIGKPYFRKNPQDKVFNPQPLYTSPRTQKPWVGLTPEDYDSMRPRVPYIVNDFSFAGVSAIVAAKLKEKNT